MIRCNNCGHENPDYCIFCQGCNTLLSSIDSDGSFKESGSSAVPAPAAAAPANYKRETPPESNSRVPPAPVNYDTSNIPREIYSPDHGEYIYKGPSK